MPVKTLVLRIRAPIGSPAPSYAAVGWTRLERVTLIVPIVSSGIHCWIRFESEIRLLSAMTFAYLSGSFSYKRSRCVRKATPSVGSVHPSSWNFLRDHTAVSMIDDVVFPFSHIHVIITDWS